jgi:RNase H-fold protein (predicted Holliday junction resolvase)
MSRVLSNIIITRCFTVYQLADIVINQLPKVIQQYDAKLVVVSDLLDMFIRDPQIETNEATHLINEIVNSITKPRALEDVLVAVSLPFHNSSSNYNNMKPFISYNKMVLTRFDKCIEIMHNHENRNKMMDIKIRNNCRRKKNTINDFHNHNMSCSIKERDLLVAY